MEYSRTAVLLHSISVLSRVKRVNKTTKLSPSLMKVRSIYLINWIEDRLNPSKASGSDDLSARVLKECSTEIAMVLAHIFNQSLIHATVPDDWRQANVAPIYKKGEKYDPANHRSVSMTSICCKPFEHNLVCKIMPHL